MGPAAKAGAGWTDPAVLLPCSLILLLSLAPPETRGEGAAGCAALIVLLFAVTGAGGTAPGARWSLLALGSASVPLILSSTAPGGSVSALAAWALALAAGFAAWMIPAGEGLLRRLGMTLGLSGGLVAVHGLVQRFWFLPRLAADLAGRTDVAYHREILDRVQDGRAFAGFSTPAAMGGLLALSLPVTVVLARNSAGRGRWLWSLAALVQVGGLFAAASATALASLLAALCLAVLAGSGRRRRHLLAGLLVLAAAGIGVAVLRGPELLDPAHGNNPLRLRAGNVRIAGEMAADRPWLGVGPGGYGDSYPAYRRPADNESMHVHNLPMELVAELGIPAGSALSVAFFVLFLGPLAGRGRMKDGNGGIQAGAAVGLAAFAIHNLADYTAFMPSLLWLTALLRGMTAEPPAAGARRAADPAALVVVLLAAVVAGLGGLSWNSRMAALDASAALKSAEAMAAADRAVRLAPWDPDPRVLRCRLLLAEGEVEAAAADADTAVGLAPRRIAARSLRSRVRLLAGDLPGAWVDAAEAARLYPASGELQADADLLGFAHD